MADQDNALAVAGDALELLDQILEVMNDEEMVELGINAERWLHLVESRRDAVVKRYSQLRECTAEPRIFSKSPDTVLPGDVVIPSRGVYRGVQCEVKDVLRGAYEYQMILVPVIPTAAAAATAFSIDYYERVRVVSKEEGT